MDSTKNIDKIIVNYNERLNNSKIVKQIYPNNSKDSFDHNTIVENEYRYNKLNPSIDRDLFYLVLNKFAKCLNDFNINSINIRKKEDFVDLLINNENYHTIYDTILIEKKIYFDLIKNDIISINNGIETIYGIKGIKIILFYNSINTIDTKIFLYDSTKVSLECFGESKCDVILKDYYLQTKIKVKLLDSDNSNHITELIKININQNDKDVEIDE